MIRVRILLFIFCLCIFKVNAQEQAPVEDSMVSTIEEKPIVGILSDTLLSITPVYLSKDSLDAIRNLKQFAYAKNLDSLLKAWQKAEGGKVKAKPVQSNSFFDNLFSSGILQFILWGIALFVVGYILYNLFLSKGIFGKKSFSKKVTSAESEEAIFERSDYEALIRQAYKLGDYRMATRYLFLKTLQQLNQRSLINFAADKTNSSYVREIPEVKRNAFAALVMNYEYVWYGNVAIDKEKFDRIETTFSTFNNKM
ncbi:MAG: hypothetical protein ABIP70_07635 [Ferruginibacter sp.]